MSHKSNLCALLLASASALLTMSCTEEQPSQPQPTNVWNAPATNLPTLVAETINSSPELGALPPQVLAEWKRHTAINSLAHKHPHTAAHNGSDKKKHSSNHRPAKHSHRDVTKQSHESMVSPMFRGTLNIHTCTAPSSLSSFFDEKTYIDRDCMNNALKADADMKKIQANINVHTEGLPPHVLRMLNRLATEAHSQEIQTEVATAIATEAVNPQKHVASMPFLLQYNPTN